MGFVIELTIGFVIEVSTRFVIELSTGFVIELSMDFVIELSFNLIKMRILILKLYMEKLSWKIEYIYILYMCIMKKKAMLVYI